jgi:hypothetical protein
MPEVKYRSEGEQIRFHGDSMKLRLGGFWWMAANRAVNASLFQQLRRDNPDVEFVPADVDASGGHLLPREHTTPDVISPECS